jgi:hypothetical protein
LGQLRRSVGLRNVLFVLGTVALYPLMLLLLATSPHDPQGAMGIGGGLMVLWFLAAFIFVIANVVLLVQDLRKGRSAHQSGVGIALPFLLGAAVMSVIG